MSVEAGSRWDGQPAVPPTTVAELQAGTASFINRKTVICEARKMLIGYCRRHAYHHVHRHGGYRL